MNALWNTKCPQSYRIASTPKTDYHFLHKDINVNVAIAGGGITGITAAYMLKKQGVTVAVIEAGRILQGTTGNTTAKLTSQHSLIYDKIKRYMGKEKARQYAEANETAIRTVEHIIKSEGIDCDFHREPAYTFTFMDSYIQKIADEAGTAASLGIKASYIENTPLPFKVKAAVRFDDQAGSGSYIFENTRVTDINEGNPCTVVTDRGSKVTADNAVIASHFPCYDGLGFYFARMYPERSYAIGAGVKERFPGGMYITAEDPAKSIHSQEIENEEILIISGEHHKTAQTVQAARGAM